MKKAPIRLMQITHDLAIGGLQQVVLNLCRNIDREAFDVSVLCLRAVGPLSKEIEKLGIKVISLPNQANRTDYFSFLKVAKIFRKERTQVIHTHNTQPLLDGTMGALLSGVRRVVHTDHARQFPDKRRYMFMEWLMSQFVYKMVGVSDETAMNLKRYEYIRPNKLMKIENGIDVRKFDIKIDSRSKKEDLGITRNGHIIGVVCRLVEVKGITYLLQAMPRIIKQIPDITLLVVGNGSELENLKLEARTLYIQNNVIFTGNRHDIPEILQVLDLLLVTSLSEGLPMIVLEAMAASLPIISTAVGGIPSVIEDGKSGYIIRTADPNSISEAVLCMLADEETRVRYAKVARRLVSQRFSVRKMARRYEKLYRERLSTSESTVDG